MPSLEYIIYTKSLNSKLIDSEFKTGIWHFFLNHFSDSDIELSHAHGIG